MFWKNDTLSLAGRSVFDQCRSCQWQLNNNNWTNELISAEVSQNGTYIIGFHIPANIDGIITGIRVLGAEGLVIGECSVRIVKRAGQSQLIRIKFGAEEV